MKNPAPRIQMLDGFNEGWIEFESGEAGSRKGKVELRTVLQRLIKRESRSLAVPRDLADCEVDKFRLDLLLRTSPKPIGSVSLGCFRVTRDSERAAPVAIALQ